MQRGDVGQCIAWNLGWLVLAAMWLGPLPHHVLTSFAAHMTLHMGVVAVAAPLLAVGWAGRRFDPVKNFSWCFSPIVASVGELIIVWGWHAPRLHHWACFETLGFVVEQLMFLLAGLWVWLAAYGGARPRNRQRSGAGVVALLLTSMHMTFLGALLALSDRLLFAHHNLGGSAAQLADQQLGGAVMLVIGGASFLIGGLVLTRDLMLQIIPRKERLYEATNI